MAKSAQNQSVSTYALSGDIYVENLLQHWKNTPAMKELFEEARIFAGYFDKPIFITGEVSTGKTCLAQAIHNEAHSFKEPRRNKRSAPYKEINCAAISPSLYESQFFGHIKGAFTGAKENRKGYIKSSEGGTLFLDEIHALPRFMQEALLQCTGPTKIFYPVGSDTPVKVDNVRFLFATTENIYDPASNTGFSKALYSRICSNGKSLAIPPLRDRDKGDVVGYAEYYIQKLIQEARSLYNVNSKLTGLKLSDEAKAFVADAAWPENIRQLQGTLQNVVIPRLPPTSKLDMVIKQDDLEYTQPTKQEATSCDYKELQPIIEAVEDLDIRNLKLREQGFPNIKEAVLDIEQMLLKKVYDIFTFKKQASGWEKFGYKQREAHLLAQLDKLNVYSSEK